MSLGTLKKAGVNAFLASILTLTGITFVSPEFISFPIPIVVIGFTLIIFGFFFGIRAAYFTYIYYVYDKDGGFF